MLHVCIFARLSNVSHLQCPVTFLHKMIPCSQVDLKCIKPSSGGYYYPSHLPVLGEIIHHLIAVKQIIVLEQNRKLWCLFGCKDVVISRQFEI